MAKAAPLKILIVDDHAALRRTVRQLFEGCHVSFLEASSGEEAVKLFGAEHPDWVVMDMRMPGMGGLKATEALRKLDARALKSGSKDTANRRTSSLVVFII